MSVTGATIIDNGQAGYSETGSGWGENDSLGYNGNYRYHAVASGADTAQWQLTGLSSGLYDVQVTWYAYPNRATNVTYQVYDGSTLRGAFTVNQQMSPSGGATVNGTTFQDLGTFQVNSGTLKVVLPDSGDSGYVIADAARFAAVAPPTTDLNWSGGGLSNVPPTVNSGTAFTATRTYTVAVGAAPGPFTIAYYASPTSTFNSSTAIPAGTETVSGSGNLSVGSHSGTSPSLQFSGMGNYYLFALLNSTNAFAETDSTNNLSPASSAMTVMGSVIIDNGQAGYSETGSGWGENDSLGYNGNYRYHAVASGADTAQWQLTGLSAGNYDVQVTWYAYPNRATNATYKVYDGTTLRGTFTVNQQMSPSGGATVNGFTFQDFGTFQVSSGTLRLVLLDSGDAGYVIADAARLANS
jgi:hypothetical protein